MSFCFFSFSLTHPNTFEDAFFSLQLTLALKILHNLTSNHVNLVTSLHDCQHSQRFQDLLYYIAQTRQFVAQCSPIVFVSFTVEKHIQCIICQATEADDISSSGLIKSSLRFYSVAEQSCADSYARENNSHCKNVCGVPILGIVRKNLSFVKNTA